jgi:hypothetical protein
LWPAAATSSRAVAAIQKDRVLLLEVANVEDTLKRLVMAAGL